MGPDPSMHIIKFALGAVAVSALAGCVEDTGSSSQSGLPLVGSSTDVTAFEGARAGQADDGLRALGYEVVRTEGLTSYWFNRSTGACARISTWDGRFSDVTMLPSEDC